MPRKSKRRSEDHLIDQVIEVFHKTTQEERQEIAQQWCMRNYQHVYEYSSTGLLPIALIIASLIDIDHPLLCSPARGVMYNVLKCSILVLRVELLGIPVDMPVYEVVHSPVETCVQP